MSPLLCVSSDEMSPLRFLIRACTSNALFVTSSTCIDT